VGFLFLKCVQLRCQLARKSENEGDYEAARKAMGDLWRQIGQRPLLDGLDEETKAAVLMRLACLQGGLEAQGRLVERRKQPRI
jgi:hypothetical protein